jgi:hypothetical protein
MTKPEVVGLSLGLHSQSQGEDSTLSQGTNKLYEAQAATRALVCLLHPLVDMDGLLREE